ncbi:MAG: prepilin-type N-terminal cleavage/methylation domain-containing protein [Phycisphaeraceae bacterium]
MLTSNVASRWEGGRGRVRGGRRAFAFSLIELVMVVAIISVVAAVAVPRFSGAERRYRVESAAGRVAADLAYVARTARARASSQAVDFALASDSYASSARPLDEGPDEPYVVRLDRAPYRATLVAVDLDGTTGLIFDGYGMPDRSGTITVGVGDSLRTITVDAETGSVTLE